jgi:hypothetical protein
MAYKYIGGAVPDEVYGRLQRAIVEYRLEYADNFRFAPMDDPEGLAEFDEMAATGCCGSWEGSATDSSGRTWKVGCNYGH